MRQQAASSARKFSGGLRRGSESEESVLKNLEAEDYDNEVNGRTEQNYQ